ncbi:putative microsomal very long chain fatty acid elongase [Tribonema minus]|uniref:Elongation of fatty acids protein n=1 Tax=Tribonema minus TaxID=303371 RepID=A0A835Z8H5_9STRA|nr:putative microsomal very long chain fatty acid elongase [Tribonema minus]
MGGTTLESSINSVGTRIIEWATNDRKAGPTADWPMADFYSAVMVVAAYLGFIFVGSFVMKFVQPLDAPTYPFRFIYNIVQIMLCSYMCLEAGIIAHRNNYGILPCVPFNVQNPPVGNVLWLFYISKILDFADTVFIVLRKKWKQLSFLHVYHHTTIFLFYWLNINVGYDGDIYLTIVLNGFIHTVMYTYYFVSMHTDKIWWKSSLTAMQMVQFVTMISQALYLLTTGCTTYPPRVTQAYCLYIFSLLILFGNFFIKSYMPKQGGKKRGSKSE